MIERYGLHAHPWWTSRRTVEMNSVLFQTQITLVATLWPSDLYRERSAAETISLRATVAPYRVQTSNRTGRMPAGWFSDVSTTTSRAFSPSLRLHRRKQSWTFELADRACRTNYVWRCIWGYKLNVNDLCRAITTECIILRYRVIRRR